MMRVKIRRIVKNLVLLLVVVLLFAFFNTFMVENVGLSEVDKLSPSLPLQGGKPNGVRVIKRTLKQNGSYDKLNVSAKILNNKIVQYNDRIKTQVKQRNSTTELEDIFISVKTTQSFHRSRVKLQLETWWRLAQEQTYYFTDDNDEEYYKLTGGHMINTNCSNRHNRKALCCKMAIEFDYFIQSEKQWFCHVDDDTYINIPQLVRLLQGYSPRDLWYLGKPSLSHPIEIRDPDKPGQKLAFWFATGGAGVCLSRGMALDIMPYASGGKLASVCDKIRLPDDCTLGYIITKLAKHDLTVIQNFHSHLEGLWSLKSLGEQLTLSYGSRANNLVNSVNVQGFSKEDDPTRMHSLHCHLNPQLPTCDFNAKPFNLEDLQQ